MSAKTALSALILVPSHSSTIHHSKVVYTAPQYAHTLALQLSNMSSFSVISCDVPICWRMWIPRSACHTIKMRRNHENRPNLTALDVDRMYQILRHMTFTMASLHPWESSFLEQWFKDSSLAFQSLIRNSLDWWYEDLPLHIFSDRLARYGFEYVSMRKFQLRMHGWE